MAFLGLELMANFASVFCLRSLHDEGYSKYPKNGQTYVLPYYINGPKLSQENVNRQFLEAEYTFLHANLVDAPVHPEVIQHQLTKKLGTFTNNIVEEANLCLEEIWGLDTEDWREVKVYDTMLFLNHPTLD
ncbi:hypothetical protein F4818DRAFT_443501 [Hypoxylon cercidicola]|nr:hypothetical protein F4818DRAFT_443501 [Hypoxylon cercidicola]